MVVISAAIAAGYAVAWAAKSGICLAARAAVIAG